MAEADGVGHHARGGYVAASALGTLAWRGFCRGWLGAVDYTAAVAASPTGLIAIVWILFLMTELFFLHFIVSGEAVAIEGDGLVLRLGASNDSCLPLIDFSSDHR